MTEFDETLSKRYAGREAITRRVQCRLSHTTRDIPYYDRGLDVSEFTYGSKAAAIMLALRDFSPAVDYDGANSRVQVYGVTVSMEE